MKVFTSYWGFKGKDTNAVSISVGSPKSYLGRHIRGLKPTWFMVKNLTGDAYKQLYLQKLERNREMILASLEEGMILLCWEKNPAECHRSIAAEWLIEQGLEVEELQKVKPQMALF